MMSRFMISCNIFSIGIVYIEAFKYILNILYLMALEVTSIYVLYQALMRD
jgi:hypothetical protein